ncbi:MAG: hypothetical protein M1825_001643 [Sarcosagium campestre]|nr:MAG: hypothetical protein M1825_001643 [Sarcosagium campestre]
MARGEGSSSPEIRVEKRGGRTRRQFSEAENKFKGSEIDPDVIQPVIFKSTYAGGCAAGKAHWGKVLERRDISGRTRAYLQNLQDKYQEGSDPQLKGRARVKLGREIDVLAQFWESTWEKVYGPESDRAKLQAIKDEHRRMVYLARVGDYVVSGCAEISSLGSSHLINTFCSWAAAWDQLKQEEERVEAWKRGEEDPWTGTPVWNSVICVARLLNPPTNPYLVRYWIKICAERNIAFHCNIGHFIRDADWKSLAAQVLDDAKEVPGLVPESSDPDDSTYARKTIERLQRVHFNKIDSRTNFELSEKAKRSLKNQERHREAQVAAQLRVANVVVEDDKMEEDEDDYGEN